MNLYNLVLGEDFLDTTPKALETEEKYINCAILKLKSFLLCWRIITSRK
jgi:hypothetical protein